MTINAFDVRPHVILCCGRVVAVTMSDRYDFTWWKPCDPGRKRSLSLAIKGHRRGASQAEAWRGAIPEADAEEASVGNSTLRVRRAGGVAWPARGSTGC